MSTLRSLTVALGLALAACGGATPAKELPHPGLPPPPAVDHHDAACGAKQLWVQEATPIAANLGAPQGKITALEITGVTPDARMKDAIGFAVGSEFDPVKGQEAIRKLFALGDVDDVALDASEKDGGVALRFRITPRPALGEIFIEGDGEQEKKDALVKELQGMTGKTYVPRALVGARLGFLTGLTQRGYLDASVDLKSAKNDEGAVDVCLVVKKGPLVTIEKVSFEGIKALKESDLLGKMETDGGKVNVAGGVVDGAKIEQSAQAIAKLYGDRGMPAVQIAYDLPRKDDKVTLVFRVLEGPVFHVRRYEVGGDKIADAGTYQKLLKVKPKDTFNQSAILADKGALDAFHKSKNRGDLEIVPDTAIDPKAATVDIIFRVVDPKKPAPKK